MDRVRALVDAGVDVIVIDSAHGHSQGVLEMVTKVKETFPIFILLSETLPLPRVRLALFNEEQTV